MTQRTDQLNSLLQQTLNEIFIREIEFPRDSLATITRVEVTPDLSWCTVWLSILPISKQGSTLKKVSSQQKKMQHLLNKTLHIRKVPKLKFEIDDTELKSRIIERELEKI
ncbi:MAG: ribosome-binding factor A [Parcubacteria group bacterium CG1_02_37_51]|uniref:Ribosome-binding factor A n=2 Tax=Candidatus Komeiliibacteriota TaxID=1817908 RepID=A0A2M8DRF7_9BACT|nr:MAG: ribosome-binding factor A [Parcubacteria group bacterium CG1_02_37_51]PIY94302.1 MAG: ribosome-binding factor A [Candidatus Komeilibacteria bacterium CG_4_10_14_0_8_um_filter_37_78]PJC01916.1 MAG: ribosome-binding factor A [Candidatus Komeilibacteria bacterium CG_4_9_14_0_8_um_filter_36_9]